MANNPPPNEPNVNLMRTLFPTSDLYQKHHMIRGPQGNEIVDHHADYLEIYGDGKVNGEWPSLKATAPMIVDTRDPTEVYEELRRDREIARHDR